MGVTCKVPELRFKEFSGEWEEKKLIELSENGFSNGAFNDPKKVGSGYRIINVKDMYVDGTIDISHLSKVALDEKEYLNNRVHYGDIFFTRSSLVKEGIAYSNVNLSNADDLTFDGHLIRMRPNKQNCSPIFLYYNFTTSYARKQFIIRGKTTTMTTIGQEDIASVKIVLPSKPEQEKIASFLSSVDNRIEQLTKKEQLLREYKKGVMQKIFSQELRFKDDDGSEFPEWVEKKFEEIFSRYDNLRIPVSSSKRISGNTPYYGANGIQDYIEGFTHYGEFILIAEDGANDLKNYPVQYVNGRIWVNNHAHVLQAKESIANNKFLKYAVSKINFEPFLVGGGRAKLNANIMMKISLNLPSLKEQTKIANFLSSLDTKIEQVSRELNLTKEFKKALLQQMFV